MAKEFANFDDEGAFPSRTLLYRCMLDLELYGDILDSLEADPLESVVGEARARDRAAGDRRGGGRGTRRDQLRISLSPDVPFFIINIWDFPEPDEEIEDELEDVVNDATYLAEPGANQTSASRPSARRHSSLATSQTGCPTKKR